MTVADNRRQTPRRRERYPYARRPNGSKSPPIDDEHLLPPGRRDPSGFWIPVGYDFPEELFSPQQRRLQEKQRQAHRARRRGRDADREVWCEAAGDGDDVRGDDGTV